MEDSQLRSGLHACIGKRDSFITIKCYLNSSYESADIIIGLIKGNQARMSGSQSENYDQGLEYQKILKWVDFVLGFYSISQATKFVKRIGVYHFLIVENSVVLSTRSTPLTINGISGEKVKLRS